MKKIIYVLIIFSTGLLQAAVEPVITQEHEPPHRVRIACHFTLPSNEGIFEDSISVIVNKPGWAVQWQSDKPLRELYDAAINMQRKAYMGTFTITMSATYANNTFDAHHAAITLLYFVSNDAHPQEQVIHISIPEPPIAPEEAPQEKIDNFPVAPKKTTVEKKPLIKSATDYPLSAHYVPFPLVALLVFCCALIWCFLLTVKIFDSSINTSATQRIAQVLLVALIVYAVIQLLLITMG